MSLSELDIIRVKGQELTAGYFLVYGLWLEVSKAHTHIRSESQAPCVHQHSVKTVKNVSN